ncbi:MAG TPA: response regulator [Galbitalea sp.]|nr:response regulator [Galbitalea sp.]
MIVEDDTLVGMGLRTYLEELGFNVVGQASNGEQAMHLSRDKKPNLVLMDIRLDDTDGIELAAQMLAECGCAIVIVSAYSDAELIARAVAAGVFGYLIKPVSKDALAAQVRVAMQRWQDQEQLIKDKQELTQTLETRKLVDRAKGLLNEKMGLTEPEAFRWIQKASMDRRLTMHDVSQAIIEQLSAKK